MKSLAFNYSQKPKTYKDRLSRYSLNAFILYSYHFVEEKVYSL